MRAYEGGVMSHDHWKALKKFAQAIAAAATVVVVIATAMGG